MARIGPGLSPRVARQARRRRGPGCILVEWPLSLSLTVRFPAPVPGRAGLSACLQMALPSAAARLVYPDQGRSNVAECIRTAPLKAGARRAPILAPLLLTLTLSACGPGPLADLPTNSSVYVEMPDGVRLAVDVWLPDDLSRRVPTLVSFTRYWRAPAATFLLS